MVLRACSVDDEGSWVCGVDIDIFEISLLLCGPGIMEITGGRLTLVLCEWVLCFETRAILPERVADMD